MQTQQATYLEFLGTPDTKMAIPVFQRVYTWRVWQCEELMGDILKAGSSGKPHFMGSIVYTYEEGDGANGASHIYNIVDGQQRTTTMFLLFMALRDYLAANGGSLGGFDAASIEDRFLFLTASDGSRSPKFCAAPADEETVAALLNHGEMPEHYKISSNVVDNHRYFCDMLEKGVDIEQLKLGLESLFAIHVRLERDDNPQLIFEGINSKGMSLATTDLLRNKLLYGVGESYQERLLERYWEPLEELFSDDKDQIFLNAALRCWLVEKDPELERCSRYEFYSAFRKYLDTCYVGTPTDLMSELLEHCKMFRRMLTSPPMKKHLDWARGNNKVAGGHKIFG